MLSRVDMITVHFTGDGIFSPNNRINVQRLIEGCSVLGGVSIYDMPKAWLLLQRMAKSFPPSIEYIHIRNGGTLATELKAILSHRRKQGNELLEHLSLNQCGRRTNKMLARLKELVETVQWDSEGESEDEDEGKGVSS